MADLLSAAPAIRLAGITTLLYRHYDANGTPLYYGITDNPEQRESNHLFQSLWPALSVRSAMEWFSSRQQAHEAERKAIKADEPLFNRNHNTPGAERRLVNYLVAHGHSSMLMPAWPRPLRRTKVVAELSPPSDYYFSMGERLQYPSTEDVLNKPHRLQVFSRSAPTLLLSADHLRARYAVIADRNSQGFEVTDIDQKVEEILELQALMDDTTRRFEILVGDSLLTSSGGGEEIMRRIQEVSYRPNVKIGCLVLGRRLPSFPPDADRRIHDYVFVLETMFGDEVEPTGRAARINGRHLDLLWPAAVVGDELRTLIDRKLSGGWSGFFHDSGIADFDEL